MITKEEKAIYNKNYYQDHKEGNKEKISERGKKYYQKNKKRIAAYRQKNKKKILARAKKYRQEHKKEHEKWRQENKDKIVKCTKKYYQDNKEEILASSKKRYRDNKEEVTAVTKKYHQEHPEVQRRADQKRKLKKLRLTHSYTKEQWQNKVDATNGICPQCNRPYDSVHPFCCTLDHKPSISVVPSGFCYTIDNVSPVCGSCNSINHVHGDGCMSLDNFIGGAS